MDLHGRLYRILGETRRRRTAELPDLVGLSERKDDIVKTFSGGMRRRLEIARGLLHHPTVLFLDEPTLGLDPQTRNLLWEYIANLAREEGITIILTTHYMEEADGLCDRVAIIDHGKIIALDTPDRLKDAIGGDVVIVRSPTPEATAPALDEPWVNRVETHDGEATISVQQAEAHLSTIVTRLVERQVTIESIAIRKPTLEDVFLHFTGKTIREEEVGSQEQMRMHMRQRRH
jgi:ABC-2 type transport system ATP-binding protein